MKAKLLVLSLFLFANLLSAQIPADSVTTPVNPIPDREKVFLYKIDQDESGLFTVTVKSTIALPKMIVGSAQVSIIAPKGGLEVVDLVTRDNALWDYFFWDKDLNVLENDYLYFGLRTPFEVEDVKVGDEIELFSFRNATSCIGPIKLLQPGDPIAQFTDINSGHDFSIIDGDTYDTYHFLNTYEVDQIHCKDSIPSADGMFIQVDETSSRSANIEWANVESAINYQLEVRSKGTANWETAKKLNTKRAKAYFYGPADQEFEGRLITNYKDGTITTSDIFSIKTLFKVE